jgi:hypothetical protein
LVTHGQKKLVEPAGFEPATSSMPSRRAPNCATAPRNANTVRAFIAPCDYERQTNVTWVVTKFPTGTSSGPVSRVIPPRNSCCLRRKANRKDFGLLALLIKYSFKHVRNLYRISVATTSVSALSLFILWNTALVLTTQNYCVVLFEVPFTDRSFQLPGWMWGRYPFGVSAISTLAAVALWIAVFVKRRRTRNNFS